MVEHHAPVERTCRLDSGERNAIVQKIQEFNGKHRHRENWMIRNLMPLVFQEGVPFESNLRRAHVFFHCFQAEEGDSRGPKWSEDIKSIYRAQLRPNPSLSLEKLQDLFLDTPGQDIACFPPSTWSVRQPFTLRKPYISRDDTDFHLLENPVKKEWVFQVPYVAPSQWKGALQAAMVQELLMTLQEGSLEEQKFVQKRLQLYRLFGNEADATASVLNRALARRRLASSSSDGTATESAEAKQLLAEETDNVAKEFANRLRKEGYKQDEVEGFQGRLRFYPTYFDRIGLEVINPHSREMGAGEQPIYFECVPVGSEEDPTRGDLKLLYVPLDREDETEARDDLQSVAAGVRAMLTAYGFGAKTSSGFGLAEADPEDAEVHPETRRSDWIAVWNAR